MATLSLYDSRWLRVPATTVAGRRLAEGDDLREIAVELDRERLAGRRQLDAVDERADDLAGLGLGCRLAQRFLQALDLASIERRQVRVDAELGRRSSVRKVGLGHCLVRLDRAHDPGDLAFDIGEGPLERGALVLRVLRRSANLRIELVDETLHSLYQHCLPPTEPSPPPPSPH